LQSAYIYLRFYQRREHGYGDFSDAFAFQTLFPAPVAPAASLLAALTFVVFKPFMFIPRHDSTTGGAREGEKAPLPVSNADPVDAERRRQRALRLLDERLSREPAA
jgi:hypothetical protein